MEKGRYDAWMQTYTGEVFHILNPLHTEVSLQDIAHALGMICRFGGHVDYFYSVAEHCVFMSHRVSKEVAPYALIHDATEAYVQDLISPIKRNVDGYKEIESRVEDAILCALGLPFPSKDISEEVHIADGRMLSTERRDLMKEPPQPRAADGFPPFDEKLNAWGPAVAKQMYLTRARELGIEYR